jgi:hypothetical protein
LIVGTLPPAAQEAIRADLDGSGQPADAAPAPRRRSEGDDAPTVQHTANKSEDPAWLNQAQL